MSEYTGLGRKLFLIKYSYYEFQYLQVAITELRLMRTLERVESLENVAKWSYRQPKKQRNLGGTTKTHWDYLLDEMVTTTLSCFMGSLSYSIFTEMVESRLS